VGTLQYFYGNDQNPTRIMELIESQISLIITQSSLLKKTTSGLSQIKIAMSENGITIHSSTLTQVSKEHSQKTIRQ